MVQRILHTVKGNRFYSLEITTSPEGEHFHLLELRKSKGELHLVRQQTFKNLDEIPGQTKKHIPIFLILNTNEVLLKSVAKAGQESAPDLLALAFPNLDREQFYYQTISCKSSNFIALTKKSVLENWLKRFSDLKLQPYALRLGPLAIEQIAEWIDGEIIFSGFLGTFDQKSLSRLSPSDSYESGSQMINGIEISSYGLLGFASILSDIKAVDINGNTGRLAKELSDTFYNQRFFTLGIQYGLFLCFALLLFNFLGWSFYTDKVNTFQDSQALNQEQIIKTKQLEKLVVSKQEKLETLQRMGNTRSSWYFDQVAQRIPSSILLDRFEYHPLLNQVRPNKPILVEKNRILIEGTARNEQDFLLWTRALEDRSWVKGVFIDDYGKAPKSGIRFSITLEIEADG
ncbi:MAG: hypothetical protein AAFU74_16320 [Bacteroidota bacterium]